MVCLVLLSATTFAADMQVNKAGFIRALKLKVSGSKGWFRSKCYFCSHNDTLGVLFERYGKKNPHFHCYKCQKSGTLKYLANAIGEPDLVSGEYVAPMDIGMKIGEEEVIQPIKECAPPVGFRRKKNIEYLIDRGVTQEQMELFKFGTTVVDPKLKGYVTLLVEEDGKVVGSVSRIMMEKEEVDRLNDLGQNMPRYRNSESDFENIVLGLDEIIEGLTTVVVAVEGAYDKLAVDRKLELYSSPEMKCVCTFGAKMSEAQAVKIHDKGVDTIIIMYDDGEVEKSKKASSEASMVFPKVLTASLDGGDPDDVTANQIISALTNAKTITEYSLNELDTNKYEL